MSFKNLPIQKKLVRIILLISGVILLVTGTAFFIYEVYTFRQAAIQKLSTLGEVIANNSTAALAFNNEADANQILSALKAEPNIVAACLYDKNNKLFSRYPKNISVKIPDTIPNQQGYYFEGSYLEGFQPVMEDTRRLGTLYIRSDLGEMYARLRLYGIVTLLVTIVAFSLSYVLSKILRKSISSPILALADTAKTISDKRDYSIRAVKSSDDELGFLTDSFNNMLVKIQEQNQSLIEFNQELTKNITERKKTEVILEQYTRDLEHSNNELEQFAYIASHDLQEPLRMVGSYMQLLQKKYRGKLDKDADDYIHFAVDGATRMKQLINDLLNYSRMTREGTVSEVNLADVLKEVQKNLHVSVSEKKAVINFNGLPVIKADRTQMLQIFQNLIGNGIKFSKDSVNPIINIKAERQNEHWLLSVQDNGIGIDKQFEDKVFVIFKRLHSTSKYSGTGIGLAIAKKIAERHGGKIWFESESGAGTTFYFTIKIKQHESS